MYGLISLNSISNTRKEKKNNKNSPLGLICLFQWGLAAFNLAAFRLSMIAPVKKSVNHPRTVASMRETG